MPQSRARPPQTAASTPTPIHGANSILVAAKQNYACGRVNHVAVEQAQEAPDIVIGMFLQLCYLILEHHILSYLLHMLGSITCP
jgi:hypothetical protein